VRTKFAVALAALAAALPARARAQASDALYSRWNVVSGFELRGYSFTRLDSTFALSSMSQWNIPVIAVAPLGRKMSADLITHVAGATVNTGGLSQTLSGLTDTQLRLLYTLGRDRAVASVSFNLPTGQHSVSTSAFQVAGAVASNYLSFPISNFGTAFGVTGGLAYAVPAGIWNLGLSGSVRYLGSYSPFSDQSISYKPGVEVRFRGGADRLIGENSRLLLGLTASTFSTDEFTGSGTIPSGTYSPGARFIGDAGYVRALGRSSISLAAWDYYRLAGANNDTTNLQSKENVLNVEVRYATPAALRLTLEPMVGFRQWSPANYRGGRMYSVGATARYGFSDQFSGSLEGRFDTGNVNVRPVGRGHANLTGYGLTLFLRYQR